MLRRQSGIEEVASSTPEPVRNDSLAQRFFRSRPRTAAAGPIEGRGGKVADETIAQLLRGAVVSPGLIQISRSFPLAHEHGGFALAGAMEPMPTPVCGSLNFRADEAIFLDLETTGLAGGVGTLAFLVGLGFFDSGSFQVELFFITAFAAEHAMLARVAERFAKRRFIVSFNGKSFDAPLLSGRYRLAAMDSPLIGMEHVDLLHPARRAFGNVWPDCRLQSLEKRLVGFVRHGDLPGSEVPAVWLDLIRWGRTDNLRAVIKHNGLDILSLAALLPALRYAYSNPAQAGARIVDVARAYQNCGDTHRALQLLEDHYAVLDRDGLFELATEHRRRKNWGRAVDIWQRLAQGADADALEALAKYAEHVKKDYAAALRYTDELIGVSGLLPEHARRRKRVQAKSNI